MLLYSTLILCALVVGAMVYRYDLYDREPWPLVLGATILGMGAMWLAGEVQVFWLERGGVEAIVNPVVVSVLAGTHEELAKWAVVLSIALVFRRRFNDPMDGIVYGSFAGLGAAIDESLALLAGLPGNSTLPATEPVRLLGHLVMGGIGGFGLGVLAVCGSWASWRVWTAAVGSLLAAMTLHFIWDMIAVPANDSGKMTRGQTAGAIAVMLSGLVAYGGCVLTASAWSRQMLSPGNPRRLVGWPFVRRNARQGRT